MKAGEVIGSYLVLQDFVVAGGMSKVSFARKGDKEYFIKEFLSPKYPTEGSPGSPAVIAKKKEKCEEFENHHKRLNNAIATKCSFGGNLVYAIDFFRIGTSYYKITEMIPVARISPREISRLPIESILIILRTITHSLKILHDLKIVHGDLKPDNILIKKTQTGGYTTKLIDFDNSYFAGEPPINTDDVVGTPEYYSPELAQYVKAGENDENRKRLTVQSDIFALGIIFTEYLTGEKPVISDKFNYVWEAVNGGEVLSFREGKKIDKLQSLLKLMLKKDWAKRPTVTEIFTALKNPCILTDDIEELMVAATERSQHNLKGTLLDPLEKEINSDSLEDKSLRGKGLNLADK